MSAPRTSARRRPRPSGRPLPRIIAEGCDLEIASVLDDLDEIAAERRAALRERDAEARARRKAERERDQALGQVRERDELIEALRAELAGLHAQSGPRRVLAAAA